MNIRAYLLVGAFVFSAAVGGAACAQTVSNASQAMTPELRSEMDQIRYEREVIARDKQLLVDREARLHMREKLFREKLDALRAAHAAGQ